MKAELKEKMDEGSISALDEAVASDVNKMVANFRKLKDI